MIADLFDCIAQGCREKSLVKGPICRIHAEDKRVATSVRDHQFPWHNRARSRQSPAICCQTHQ
jgi:hypothetical protein